MLKLSRNTKIFLSMFLLFSLVTLACAVTIPRANSTKTTATPEAVQALPTTNPTQVSIVSSEDQVLVDIYARLNPSVVNISVYSNMNGALALEGQGSGFVYDNQGHIVTNAHVVEGTDSYRITFSDGLIRNGTLVAEDLFSDLAVVKVDLPAGVNPIPMGNMDQLAVGQTVVAIGNPFGLQGSLTRGIISALGRSIPSLTQYDIPQSIQTDAAINPGNSGGPLINLNGEVVGVNAQIETSGTSSSNVGVGFAVPVSIIQRVVPSLIKDGHYDWPWLGVGGYTVYPELVTAMSLPVERGAYVSTLTDGSPALAAGLQATTGRVTEGGFTVEVGGDVITAIDGQTVNTFNDLLVYLSLHTSPGQQVTLTILRDGKFQDIKLELGTRQIQ